MLSILTQSAIQLKRASRFGELLTNRHLSLPTIALQVRANFASVRHSGRCMKRVDCLPLQGHKAAEHSA